MAAQPPSAHDPEAGQIRDLLRDVTRRNPVHVVVSAVLDGDAIETADMDLLLEALRDPADRRWRERTAAAWALGRTELDPKQRGRAAEVLCAVLADNAAVARQARDERLTRAARRAVAPLLGGAAAYGIAAALAMLGGRGGDLYLGPYSGPILLLCLAVGALALATLGAPVWSWTADRHDSDCVRAAAAVALARLGVVESAGLIARATFSPHGQLRARAFWALWRVLPLLTEADADRLSRKVTPDLCRLLRQPEGHATILVLDALGRVGDRRAMKPVERLLWSAGSREVRDAAQRAWEALFERYRRERAAGSLLRAALPPGMDRDSLLRPARSAADPDPLTLLLPVDRGGDSDRAA